ncbi:hypothetical protein SPPR111872_13105 [Sphingobacterium prati]
MRPLLVGIILKQHQVGGTSFANNPEVYIYV